MTGGPENLLTEWASLLMESLADAGVTDIILSPGSRSSPFALAAARSTRLRCTDVIDERAAAFFALGQARVTGRPAAVLCTSGSAGAHYLPAAIEATASGTPLLLITADRPYELHGCAAPQTIDQVKLFADHCRAFFELGIPDVAPKALRGLRRMAAQAVHVAMWPLAGAVHLNARARKPLEPAGAKSPAGQQLAAAVKQILARPIGRATTPEPVPSPTDIAEIAELVRESRRGLVICGPIGIHSTGMATAAGALAAAAGYPLLPEASSQVRFASRTSGASHCDVFDIFLRSARFRERARPDLIIQLGGTPTSAAWEHYLDAHPDVRKVVVHPHPWRDPQSGSTIHLVADCEAGARAIASALEPAPARDDTWNDVFAAADSAAARAVQVELSRQGDQLTEGATTRAVLSELPSGSLLAIGNSMPLRLVDAFCEQGAADARVLVQRGANGIDGLVAGAAGSASVSRTPLTLLLGDVSLLHDLTSLSLLSAARVPCVVVVIQNRGGRIFELLPIASSPAVDASAMAHIITPHDLSFEHAARMFGVKYARVDRVGQLRESIAAAYRNQGATLVEAVVPPSGNAELARRIWASCERAVEELAGSFASGA
jgi:2-succinyl-5-enolpyruvyl-6-hydroxy-3-cyclohexene-1-carboxylate synthase